MTKTLFPESTPTVTTTTMIAGDTFQSAMWVYIYAMTKVYPPQRPIDMKTLILGSSGRRAVFLSAAGRDFARLFSVCWNVKESIRMDCLPKFHRTVITLAGGNYGKIFPQVAANAVPGSGLCGGHALYSATRGVKTQAEIDNVLVSEVQACYGTIAEILREECLQLRQCALFVESLEAWAAICSIGSTFMQRLATLINCFKMVDRYGYGALDQTIKDAVKFDNPLILVFAIGLRLKSITVIRPDDHDPDKWTIVVVVNPFKVCDQHPSQPQLLAKSDPIIYNVDAHYWLLSFETLPQDIREQIVKQYAEYRPGVDLGLRFNNIEEDELDCSVNLLTKK